MAKPNCWEFKKCGQESKCPAAIEVKLDKTNSGRNGGRCCWVITGTLCDGKVQGSFPFKLSICANCEFFKLVRKEEGESYSDSRKILEKIKGK